MHRWGKGSRWPGSRLSHRLQGTLTWSVAPTAASLVGTSAKPTDDADDATAVAGGWSGTAWTDRASATGSWRGSLRSKDRFHQQRQLGASCDWSDCGRVGTARHRRSLHVRSVKSEYSTGVRCCQLCPQSGLHREHAALPRSKLNASLTKARPLSVIPALAYPCLSRVSR